MPPAEGQDWEEGLRQAWVEEPPKLDGRVQLAEYDPGWPGQYEGQATRIRSALGDRILLLEHIGSTSVPGLAAKPVIDILLRADRADRELYESTKRRLAARDWTYTQQYADAKGEVVEAIMRRAGPENPGDPRETGDPV